MLAAKLLGASGTAAKTYVDDVFSAYTYTGNGSTQTITNGIDLAGRGGMVWIKNRVDSSTANHQLAHTARGNYQHLETNTTAGNNNQTSDGIAFSSSGFGFTTASSNQWNANTKTYVAWTFRNAEKFYNHTTVTKTAGSNATVSFASLTTLGMVRVKRTDSTGSWYIWHRSLTAGKLLIGETTAAEATLGHITVSGTTVTLVNGVIADGTYLVEGFAHDTGTDGLIQCGSLPTSGSVTLGWEPQFVLWKDAPSGWWYIYDTARGFTTLTSGVANGASLNPNNSNAESFSTPYVSPNPTGFTSNGATGATSIYLAIRRPNKPPTTGTQVYNAIARTGDGGGDVKVTGAGFAPDLVSIQARSIVRGANWYDRLRGANYNSTNTTAAETTADSFHVWPNEIGMDGIRIGSNPDVNGSGTTYINHFFKRAPGVLSQICYSGTGANKTESHDLGVAPELWLVKGRSGATQWVWGSSLLANTEKIVMPTPAGKVTDATAWNSTYPTSTVLSLGTAAAVNTSAATYTAYLWATLAGVSKVFAYTGDGTSGKVINCGFTTGARFVMIVRTSAAGSVFIWDTARGIVAGNDPHLCLDTTAAEVTTDDSIDPDTSGFAINQVAATNINVNGATYIGLAYS